MCGQNHQVGAKVLIDACQSVPHFPINVQQIDCDWLVASGHKMCAPTGIGFLYGKKEILDEMPPFFGGGEMIADVYLDHFTSNELPHKFEAGTPAIGEAIALGTAVDYLMGLGMDNIHAYEEELTAYLFKKLADVPQLRIYGPKPTIEGKGRAALASFNVESIHASDLSTLLDHEGIAIRSGHHCTQPLHRLLNASGSARASLYFYNTREDIDRFIVALKDTIDFFDHGKLGATDASTIRGLKGIPGWLFQCDGGGGELRRTTEAASHPDLCPDRRWLHLGRAGQAAEAER